MAFDRTKFKALVHYVCWRCKLDPSKLGAIKLNKILWLADFLSYYRSDEPLTGERYIKRAFGPVPGSIMPVLRELEFEQKVIARDVPYHGKKKREFMVLKDPDISLFTEAQLDLVNSVTQYVTEEHTAKTISDESHDHIWRSAEDGEEIPYYTIFSVPGQITADEREWARAELEGLQK